MLIIITVFIITNDDTILTFAIIPHHDDQVIFSEPQGPPKDEFTFPNCIQIAKTVQIINS